MLKTTMLSPVLAAKELLDAKVFPTNDVVDVKGSSRFKRLKPKTRRSESRKLSKSKKPSKSGNLPKFNAKKNRPDFLIPGTNKTLNSLQLVFTKAPIL